LVQLTVRLVLFPPDLRRQAMKILPGGIQKHGFHNLTSNHLKSARELLYISSRLLQLSPFWGALGRVAPLTGNAARP